MKISRAILTATMSMMVAAVPANAQVSWSMTSFGTDGSSAPSADKCRLNNATNGNVATCDATGSATDLLKVRGYSFSGSSTSSTVSKGLLDNYDPSGIGMCNMNEAWSCGSPNHAVDNFGTFTDFAVFESASEMALKSVSFGWTYGDADFTILRYAGANDPYTALNNNATTMSGLLSGGWSVLNSVDGSGAGTYTGFNNGDLMSRFWIVATYNTALSTKQGLDAGDDAFKISGISGKFGSPNISSVPEPSTYALMTAGLLGILGAARRRRRA